MTSMNHIICLSSDEEDDKIEDYSGWLEEVLENSTEKHNSTAHRKSNPSNPEEDGDDDCVVLDCDPYKTTEKKETKLDTCEADEEILVVGEKGEIACRDFPHPRHACAKYPFKSTSHEKYCDMCHCYVCDIRAPCPNWCIGIPSNSIDHCHANDKEEIWKNYRACLRTGVIPPRLASTMAQLQQLSQTQSIQSPQNSLYSPVNQFGIRACSASTMVVTRPTTYIRPGYGTEQSTTLPQYPGLQPRGAQLFQNQRDGYSSPHVISSNRFTWDQRPSRVASLPEMGIQNVLQGSRYPRYAPPHAALQANSPQMFSGYISTVPESHSKSSGRKSSRTRYYAKVQTSAVPPATRNPPVNQQQQQQQQSGRSNAKVLSEIEDWLMDNSTPTG
ncbi:hypothetical protein EUTSA_v10027052mg [Eutrema salsugineum]|uniref:RPM1 interacting protein 13 n=1 Tax=Eutrema salsugineum TaxID=72664 RepID=V4MGG1_EUTSA|nr:uncharacterized protein LOC18028704 [Eutrema salsugineum]ESQ54377.1 hypothetical protein EUTSA_v10027052mg [Eutrema salsugineum]